MKKKKKVIEIDIESGEFSNELLHTKATKAYHSIMKFRGVMDSLLNIKRDEDIYSVDTLYALMLALRCTK